MNLLFLLTSRQMLPCDYSKSYTSRNQVNRFRIAGFTPPAGITGHPRLCQRCAATGRNWCIWHFDLTTAVWLHLQLTDNEFWTDV